MKRKQHSHKQLWYRFDDNSKLWKLNNNYYLQEIKSHTLKQVRALDTKILGRVSFELNDEKIVKKCVETLDT